MGLETFTDLYWAARDSPLAVALIVGMSSAPVLGLRENVFPMLQTEMDDPPDLRAYAFLQLKETVYQTSAGVGGALGTVLYNSTT